MSQNLIFRGKQVSLYTVNKERISTGSLCSLFYQGLFKASGFHNGNEVSRAATTQIFEDKIVWVLGGVEDFDSTESKGKVTLQSY